ncbi:MULTISPECIES: NAD(P)/FAD-dependent oxidoreductase [Burkholderia]|uniref:NAD(P)/FAD-dependent oxidoreductase n=1 Tax=Burkholderia TaxID=32008 RepID=UPI00119A6AD4|nr:MULTISPECIES: FAD-binding oxidoreductase [Burkholderia]MBJ9661447.1 FAD-binding oxidoreductase [Burkholderia gladioli]MBJ9713829.1 FAD-binding oxidoreductase [Burkholderia gladioli]MBU9158468.1 FAD-binding oxidoreductase [Burkholderia gladioli]MBU9170954.1 FAD-binding oxidoreductase [Burkholderia gladioli]MBU9218081.1 FAD-binding oxidoreductase [Burkholderia gladioli]
MRPDALLFHDDFRLAPYWWDAAPPETDRSPLPGSVELLVIGSGYCGLSAAAEAARHGLATAVIDAAELGAGGSTRSGGMVSSGQKLALTKAIRGVSAERLQRLMRESIASFDFLKQLIADEGLDADLQISGRFFGAYTTRHFDTLRAQGELLRDKTGVTVHVISREQQRALIGSDYYYGGILIDDYGGLHTAKYHRALRALARRRGASLHSHAGAERIERLGGGRAARFRVHTARGTIEAAHVLVATNGYTGDLLPFLARRVLPVASYQIATEPLPPGLMDALNPGRRMVSDSRRNLFYTRPSPDGTRILFGSRPAIRDLDERDAARRLHAKLVGLWPALRDVRLTHAWKGFVAMTTDRLAHLGEADGIHYALGCNGNGVALMSWLGQRIARRLVGAAAEAGPFGEGGFPLGPMGLARSLAVPVGAALYQLDDYWSGRHRSALA